MNKKMEIVKDWIVEKSSYETSIIELEGEYETVPNEVYEAYYALSPLERLKVFKNAVSRIIKKY